MTAACTRCLDASNLAVRHRASAKQKNKCDEVRKIGGASTWIVSGKPHLDTPSCRIRQMPWRIRVAELIGWLEIITKQTGDVISYASRKSPFNACRRFRNQWLELEFHTEAHRRRELEYRSSTVVR